MVLNAQLDEGDCCNLTTFPNVEGGNGGEIPQHPLFPSLLCFQLCCGMWKDGVQNQFFIALTHYGCECNRSIVVVFRWQGFLGTDTMVDVLQRMGHHAVL